MGIQKFFSLSFCFQNCTGRQHTDEDDDCTSANISLNIEDTVTGETRAKFTLSPFSQSPNKAFGRGQIHPMTPVTSTLIIMDSIVPPGKIKNGVSCIHAEHVPQRQQRPVDSEAELKDEGEVRRPPATRDQSVQTEPVAFQVTVPAGNPVGPPPPGSHCNNEHHSYYCTPSRRFSSEELKDLTNDFSIDSRFGFRDDEKLYTGRLDGRLVFVARKETEEMSDFSIEVNILECLRHPNIMFLIGYCDEYNNRALVFNFVCNRTLFFHLSLGTLRPIQWLHRADLAVKLAKCLLYLHDSNIIHGSVNSMNVFVTHDFAPVIGDFSFSRNIDALGNIILQDRSEDKRARGYLPPEYEVGKKLSEKQDIYAFGVILFELVSGRPAFDRMNKTNHHLGEWGRNTVKQFETAESCKLLATMQDPRLNGSVFNKCDMLRMIKVAEKCTSEDPNERPYMPVVLDMLTGNVDFGGGEAPAPPDPAEPANQETRTDQDTLPTESGSALTSVRNDQTSLSDLFGGLEVTCKNNDNFRPGPVAPSSGNGSRRPSRRPRPSARGHTFRRTTSGTELIGGSSTPYPRSPKHWSGSLAGAPSIAGFTMSPQKGKGVVYYVPYYRTSGGADSEIRTGYRVRFEKQKSSSVSRWRDWK